METTTNKLAAWIASHGISNVTVLSDGRISFDCEWSMADGTRGVQTETVSTVAEARKVLGY